MAVLRKLPEPVRQQLRARIPGAGSLPVARGGRLGDPVVVHRDGCLAVLYLLGSEKRETLRKRIGARSAATVTKAVTSFMAASPHPGKLNWQAAQLLWALLDAWRQRDPGGAAALAARKEFELDDIELRTQEGHRRAWRKAFGKPLPHGYRPRVGGPGRARGERCHTARLNAEHVQTIRRRHASGEPIQHLAREYGVDPGSVGRAIARKTWQHVV